MAAKRRRGNGAKRLSSDQLFPKTHHLPQDFTTENQLSIYNSDTHFP